MKLLHELIINNGKNHKKIQLFNGDLSAIPKNEFSDLLVISAFPNDYTPLPASLIGALHKKGLSVLELSKQKEIDMKKELGCWFSAGLSNDQQRSFNFKRILCFEPVRDSGTADEVVGNIYRCINNFVFDEQINRVAMPIVATGYQKFPRAKMCRALLEATIFWLEKGLPVDTVKLVQHDTDSSQEVYDVFKEISQEYRSKQTPAAPEQSAYAVRGAEIIERGNTTAPVAMASQSLDNAKVADEVVAPPCSAYDLFVSYSHKQKEAADRFVTELKSRKPALRIFYDNNSIPKGAQWLKVIADAIDCSAKVIIFISPEYTQSKICWDEFQCAKLREYNSDVQLLITIYLYNHTKLPTIFQLNSWIDCREGDPEKIKAACTEVLNNYFV